MAKKKTLKERAKAQGYITVTEAAEICGLSQPALHKKIKIVPRPGYFVKVGGRFFIDPSDIEFQSLKKDIEKNKIETMEHELRELKKKSIEAKFYLPIQKFELNKFKLEKEKLDLEKEARQLIQFELAQYLFTGYLERINREALHFPKRVQKEINLIIQGGLYAGHNSEKTTDKIIKIISRELEAILRDIIKEQKKDLLNWEDENKT